MSAKKAVKPTLQEKLENAKKALVRTRERLRAERDAHMVTQRELARNQQEVSEMRQGGINLMNEVEQLKGRIEELERALKLANDTTRFERNRADNKGDQLMTLQGKFDGMKEALRIVAERD